MVGLLWFQGLMNMLFPSLRWLAKVRPCQAKRRYISHSTYLSLEVLESRLVPNNTTFTWTGAAMVNPTQWENAGNWTGGVMGDAYPGQDGSTTDQAIFNSSSNACSMGNAHTLASLTLSS